MISRTLHIRNAGKRLVILVMMVLPYVPTKLYAQQEWSYTQYLFNLYDINSAYAGNHGAGSFGVRYRSQWIGLPGAPETRYLSFHTPMFNEKAGAGIRVINENIGARGLTTAKASLAYKLRLSGSVLSFGLGGGIIRQAVDVDVLNPHDPQDVQLQTLAAPTITPIVDFSIFFNSKRFFAGVESCGINRSHIKRNEQSMSRLYYNLTAIAGYMQPIGRGNILQASALMRMTERNIWQAEVNILYLVKNRLWFGGGYRFAGNAQVMACFNFSEQLRIGLSYDISTQAIRQFNDGSAEIFLGFNFKNKSGKSIRYF